MIFFAMLFLLPLLTIPPFFSLPLLPFPFPPSLPSSYPSPLPSSFLSPPPPFPPHPSSISSPLLPSSVVIQWSPPSSLPSGTPVTNYRVYVNGQYKESVQGSGKMSAHLRDIPRQQLVKISVRTVTEEGESSDPQKMVVLNPRE